MVLLQPAISNKHQPGRNDVEKLEEAGGVGGSAPSSTHGANLGPAHLSDDEDDDEDEEDDETTGRVPHLSLGFVLLLLPYTALAVLSLASVAEWLRWWTNQGVNNTIE